MRRLHNPRQSAARPSLRKRLAVMACAGLTALTAPKVESTAHAEQITARDSDFRFNVTGEMTMMTEGEESAEVHRALYIVSRQLEQFPEVEIEGPARLTVTFYPAVLREWFNEEGEEVSRTVRYRMENGGEGREQVFSGDTSLSEATSPDIPRNITNESGEEELNPLAIGTPIEETIEIPEGEHRVTIVAPNGLVNFDAEQIIVEPEPVEAEPPEPEPVAVEPEPVAEPEVPQETERRISFMLEGRRVPMRLMGSGESSGDLNNVFSLVDVGLSDHFGIVSGISFASYGIDFSSPDVQTDIRTFNGSIMVGPSFVTGRHRLFAAAVLGYNGVFTDAVFASDGAAGIARQHMFEYGGMLGYEFDDYLRITVGGGSNALVPLSAQIYGALPMGYGYSDEARAWARLEILYMQMPVPADGEAVDITEGNFYGRLSVGAPIFAWRAGNGVIMPGALVAGDMNASGEGVHSLDVGVAGSLAATARGFEFEAIGGASVFSGEPFFMLRTGYRR